MNQILIDKQSEIANKLNTVENEWKATIDNASILGDKVYNEFFLKELKMKVDEWVIKECEEVATNERNKKLTEILATAEDKYRVDVIYYNAQLELLSELLK